MHPQSRLLGADAVEKFFAGLWQVTRRGDRVGVRLEGARMTHAVGVMASHVTLPGDIEVTPDGGAVVLGPDGPVTGGYPVIASVIDADLPSMMQARSGEWVRFAPVSMSEARAAVREQAERMKTLLAGGGA
jgi:allophanate hydrolase subunit 2